MRGAARLREPVDRVRALRSLARRELDLRGVGALPRGVSDCRAPGSRGRARTRHGGRSGTSYALVVVMFGWVLFRADSFGHAIAFFAALLDPTRAGSRARASALHVDAAVLTAVVAGVVGATPAVPYLAAWRARLIASDASAAARRLDGALAWAEVGLLAGVFFLAAATLSASTYNPFIYFRF